MSYHYLLDLALILLSTKVLGMLTRRFQMPQVVGALLAGLILGPAVLNVLSETEFLTQLSELGVIVILFTAGMGTDLRELRDAGKAGFFVALCGVLVPLAMGTAFGYLAGRAGWLPEADLLECVFLGTVLTATSVSITVETLKEMGRLDTKVGGTILAAALIDDVLGIVALTIVTSLSGKGGGLGLVLLKIALFFALSVLVGFVLHRLISLWFSRWNRDKRRFLIVAFALCLLYAYLSEVYFGVADITGAYIMGIIFANTPRVTYLQDRFDTLSCMLLSPVFFASIGLKVALPEMSASIVLFALLLVLVALVSKVVGCGLGARLCGYSTKDSLQVGVGMISRGEVALIVANRGLSMGVLSQAMMTPIIITVVGGTILTPILLKLAFRGHSGEPNGDGRLVDRYNKAEQLDRVSERLLQADHDLMNKK